MRMAVFLAAVLAAAGCKLTYGPGERPFEQQDEFPGLVAPAHAGWKVVGVKGGDVLLVERVLGTGGGPFEEEEELREIAGIPHWKRSGEGRFEVALFGIRIPSLSDEFNQASGDKAAEDFLKRTVLGRRVSLIPTSTYGSAFAWVQGTDVDADTMVATSTLVNLELVLNGLAMVDSGRFLSAGANWRMGTEYRTFKTAEEDARARKLGLWRFSP